MVRESKGEFKLPYIFELGEKTWRVLLALLFQRIPLGPREIARQLNFSTHSLALYHINKLLDLDLVEKTPSGDYQIHPDADLRFLHEILYVKRRIVPMLQIVYALFFAFSGIIFLAFVGFDYSIQSGFALTICMMGAFIFSIEAYRTWMMSGLLPIENQGQS